MSFIQQIQSRMCHGLEIGVEEELGLEAQDAWVVFFIPDPGQPDLNGSTTAAEGVAVDDQEISMVQR